MNVGITHRHSVACRSDEQKGETKQNRDSSFCRFVYTTQLYVRPFILRSYSCALLNVLIFWALSSECLFYLIILNFCLIELIKIKLRNKVVLKLIIKKKKVEFSHHSEIIRESVYLSHTTTLTQSIHLATASGR